MWFRYPWYKWSIGSLKWLNQRAFPITSSFRLNLSEIQIANKLNFAKCCFRFLKNDEDAHNNENKKHSYLSETLAINKSLSFEID